MKRSKSTEKPEPPPPPPRQPWLSWIAGVLTLGLLLTGLGARINARTTLLEELGSVQRQKVVIHAKEPPDWLLENKLEQNIAAVLRESEDGPATAVALDSHTPIELVGKTIERAWWIDSFEVRRNLGRIEANVVYRKPLLWVDVDPQQKLGFYLDRLGVVLPADRFHKDFLENDTLIYRGPPGSRHVIEGMRIDDPALLAAADLAGVIDSLRGELPIREIALRPMVNQISFQLVTSSGNVAIWGDPVGWLLEPRTPIGKPVPLSIGKQTGDDWFKVDYSGRTLDRRTERKLEVLRAKIADLANKSEIPRSINLEELAGQMAR